jgi:hypothetical protein
VWRVRRRRDYVATPSASTVRPGLALALALALAGCGASRNEVDPGFPPSNPRAHRATTLLPLLSGQRLRIVVPDGWEVAWLTGPANGRQALVHLQPPCYEAISITGSSVQSPTGAEIASRYGHAFASYSWTLSRAGGHLIALLGQFSSRSLVPARGTVGTAYVPMDARRELAVDFGAGIWPLRRGPCSSDVVAARVPALRATVLQTFEQARVLPTQVDPVGSGIAG